MIYIVYYESRKWELIIRLMNGWTTKQTRNTYNKKEIHECDGRVHDPDSDGMMVEYCNRYN